MRFEGAVDIALGLEYPNTFANLTFLPDTGMDFTINTLKMDGLVIYGSDRKTGGGAISIDEANADVCVSNCYFINNQVSGRNARGGAMQVKNVQANVLIVNTTFLNNFADCLNCSGGALFLSNTVAEINSCYFELNEANWSGGAIDIDPSYSTSPNLTVIDSSFSYNSAMFGGAIHYSETGLVKVMNCSFINNLGIDSGGAMFLQGPGMGFVSTGNLYIENAAKYGGVVYSKALQTSFQMDCFVNNSGDSGAAIQQRFNRLEVRSCNFTNNSCWREFEGGVIEIRQGNLTLSEEVNFIANIGSLQADHSSVTYSGTTRHMLNTGGALAIQGGTVTFNENSETFMIANYADTGGGLYVDKSNVTVIGLLIIAGNEALSLGGGIVAYDSVLEFREQLTRIQMTNITSNIAQENGGGMYLSATRIRISNSHFYMDNNVAKRFGGAMYLDEDSNIHLNKLAPEGYLSVSYIQLVFRNNTALRGGGVYMSDEIRDTNMCSTTDNNANDCFLQTVRRYKQKASTVDYSKIVVVFFQHNHALESGNDLYGGLLDRCGPSVSPEAEELYLTGVGSFDGLGYIIATVSFNQSINKTSDLYDHISSDPVRVCICNNNVADCSFTHPTVFKKKGETFTLSSVALDQVGKPVNATLVSSLKSRNGDIGRLKEGQQARHIPDHCQEVEYNVFSNNNTAIIQLYADGPCKNEGISKQEVEISFLPCTCPKGFERIPSNINCSCTCDRRIKPFVSNCSASTSSIQIDLNVWIAYVNSSNMTGFVIQNCSFDYCVPRPVNVSFSTQRETNKQCAFNRSRTLCGQCETGLSLVFASSKCHECSNYYLFLILPFAVAGIALVAFILLLNMTVATGTIHGLILYANILAANRSIFLPFDTPNFLTVFISWLNLDLGIETCFYGGMDSYGKFLLQLVFPVYVFILIGVIIILSRYLPERIAKKNPEATLYTLILLSYSKLIRVIITALQFTTLTYPDGSQTVVWLFDGNVQYFMLSHIPRFLVAIIIMIAGAVYTALLLFGQLFDRCSEYRLMKWTTHKYYIHFMKAHHAPLADKHRYWVGLLLLVRLIHYLISAFSSNSVVIMSVGMMALLLLVYRIFIQYPKPHLILQCAQRCTEVARHNSMVYCSWWPDFLEFTFLINLLVFSLSRFYVGDVISSQQVVAIVSMALSLLTFAVIVSHHTGILNCCRRAVSKIGRIRLRRQYQGYHPVPIEDNDENILLEEQQNGEEQFLEDEELLDYAADTANEPNDPPSYNTPPIIRFAERNDQLREPALDDLAPVQPEDYNIPRAPQPRPRAVVTYTEVDITLDDLEPAEQPEDCNIPHAPQPHVPQPRRRDVVTHAETEITPL